MQSPGNARHKGPQGADSVTGLLAIRVRESSQGPKMTKATPADRLTENWNESFAAGEWSPWIHCAVASVRKAEKNPSSPQCLNGRTPTWGTSSSRRLAWRSCVTEYIRPSGWQRPGPPLRPQQTDMQKSKLLLPHSPPGHGKGPPQLAWISALREEELSGVDSSGDWSCGWHSMPTLGSRLDANSKTEPGSADGVGRRGWHSNKAGCSDTVTDAGEVSHINGWVSLVSDIHVGLAYLIDLPEKTQAKMGKGEEKRHIFNRESQRQGKLRTFQTWHGS